MAVPDSVNHARGHLDAPQRQLLQAMTEMLQRVDQDRPLDLFRNPDRMRAAHARQPVDKAFGAIGLEVPADLVELLTAVPYRLARLHSLIAK